MLCFYQPLPSWEDLYWVSWGLVHSEINYTVGRFTFLIKITLAGISIYRENVKDRRYWCYLVWNTLTVSDILSLRYIGGCGPGGLGGQGHLPVLCKEARSNNKNYAMKEGLLHPLQVPLHWRQTTLRLEMKKKKKKNPAQGGGWMKWPLKDLMALILLDSLNSWICKTEGLTPGGSISIVCPALFSSSHRVCPGVPYRRGKASAVREELGEAGESVWCLDQRGWPQQGKAFRQAAWVTLGQP